MICSFIKQTNSHDVHGFTTINYYCMYNEELNDLYSSPNVVRVIKSRRMRWAGNVARMGE